MSDSRGDSSDRVVQATYPSIQYIYGHVYNFFFVFIKKAFPYRLAMPLEKRLTFDCV